MSVPIQTSPRPTIGAQTPLATDTDARRGDEFPQDNLSFCRGVNVEASSNPIAARDGQNNGSGVTGRTPDNIRHVDQRCIEGSYKGDTRKSGDTASASLARAANGAGVRGPAGQFPNGKRDMTLGSFSKDHADESYPTPENGD
jgi:hypothetical protein